MMLDFQDLQITSSLELKYAKQFQVDYLTNYTLISIYGGDRFLVIPFEEELPLNIPADITIIHQPCANIYLAATSAMCLFDALEALDRITLSGTQAEGWYIDNARQAMEEGQIIYAGKYSAPDYELLLAKECGLAIESTMLLQKPEVKEKLELLGIPVLIERSSYEEHPLGRLEWIKLYGVLVGKLEFAIELFETQNAYLLDIVEVIDPPQIAFFYISSAGTAVVRKNGDYVTKMIELAGGQYVFSEHEDSKANGSSNLNMERFYAEAKDADIIIYNSSIDGEIKTMTELIHKSHLLADFKAIKDGMVWCTNRNLFQEATSFGMFIEDIQKIILEEVDEGMSLNYLTRLP